MHKKLNPAVTPIMLAKTVTKNDYEAPKHIRYLECEILEKLRHGNARIIVNMPPRHGKSEFISKYLPAWYLMNNPEKRIILISYEATFAMSWCRKIRDIIGTYGESIAEVALDPTNNTQSGFSIKGNTGGLNAVGAGGAITGKGADLVIIDDPVKNDAEANSETCRENLWEWFRSTVYTRLEPGGSIILLMTRWHEDDLTGKIMSDPVISREWTKIVLPAVAKEDDPLGREKGEVLWKRRYDNVGLQKIQNTIGTYWFSALYDQQPRPSEGAIFQRSTFKYFTMDDMRFYFEADMSVIDAREVRIFATVDLAASRSETSDYTVVLVFGVSTEGHIFIMDIVRNKFDTLKHKELIVDVYKRYHPQLIGVESVQYQNSLVREIAALGIPVKALHPTTDKVTRALPMQAKMEIGNVYFLKYAAWLDAFESELLAFPNVKHDDQVDCFAYINDMIIPGDASMPVSVRRKSFLDRFETFI